MTALYKITLRRSPIGLPKTYMRNIKALGLRKTTGSVSYRPVARSWAGMILRIKELVKVELTTEEKVDRAEVEAAARKQREVGWVRV
jgi:ribosomal protein L30